MLPDDFGGLDVLQGHGDHITDGPRAVCPGIESADGAFEDEVGADLAGSLTGLCRIDHAAFLLVIDFGGDVSPAGGIDKAEHSGFQNLATDKGADRTGVDTGIRQGGGIQTERNDHDGGRRVGIGGPGDIARGEHRVDHRLDQLVDIGLSEGEGLHGRVSRIGPLDRAGAGTEKKDADQAEGNQEFHDSL